MLSFLHRLLVRFTFTSTAHHPLWQKFQDDETAKGLPWLDPMT